MVPRVLRVAAGVLAVACGGSAGDGTQSGARPDSAAALSKVATSTTAPVAPKPRPKYRDDDIGWLDSIVDTAIDFDKPATIDPLPGNSNAYCYSFARHNLIAITDQNDLALSDIIVRPNTGSSGCGGADSVAGDYVIRDHNFDDFLEMKGDWVALSGGTDVIRALSIFDVASRAEVASFQGEIAGWRDSTHLLIWASTKAEPARSQCPKVSQNLFVGADSLFEVDLRGHKRVALGRWRCAARQ